MSEGKGLSKGRIISNKLILTYKRKRLSSHSDQVQHVEGTCSPKLRISVKPESSFLTGRVEIDDTNGTPELLQHQGESNKQKDRSTERVDTGPMRLRSCKMLLPGCTSKIKLESNRYSEADSSITKEPCTVGNTFSDMTTGSPDKMCIREESKFHLLDLNISGNPRLGNLNIPAKEKSITVLPESVPNRVISGNNELFTETESAEVQTDVLKEEKRKKKHARHFITFHRRTKKKRNACEMDTNNKQSVDRICDPAMTCNKPSPDLKYVYAEQSDKVGQHEKLLTSSELKLNTVTAYTRIRPESNNVLRTEIGGSEGPSQCLQAGPLNQIVNSGVAECQQKLPLIFMSMNSSPIPNNCNEIVPENKLLNIEPSVDRELDICSADVSEKVEQAAVLDSMENGTRPTTNLVSSSVQNGGFLTSAHGRGNPLQCLNDLNETPLETHKEISTSLKRNGANHGQVVDLQLFNANPVNEKGPVLLESASRGNMNHTICSHERTSLTNSTERGSETQNYLKAEKSPLLSNFLGLAPPQPEIAANFIQDFGNKPSTSSLDHRDSFMSDGRFRNPHRLSPVSSHRQIFENFMNSTRFINQGQGFPLEFKRHPRAWSEEELDSLWIGVRRHGRNNWNAMLRDPTMYFSEMRIAQDLSERWDIEQSKLFSGTAVNSVEPVLAETLSARPMFGNYQNNCGISHHIPNFQTSRPETHLSLGHAYTQKMECFSSRKPFYFSDLGINHQLVDVNRTSSSYLTDLSSRNAFWKNLGLTEERPSRDQNLSMLEPITSGKCRNFFQPYAGQPTNGNLPHWLREAVSIPPQKPRDTSLTSCVSAIAPPVISMCPGQHPASNRDPSELLSKDLRKCTFERSITGGSRTGKPKAFDPASTASLPKQSNLTPTIGFTSLELGSQSNLSSKKNMHHLNKNSTETSLKRELVILDSDISSEETISDNSA